MKLLLVRQETWHHSEANSCKRNIRERCVSDCHIPTSVLRTDVWIAQHHTDERSLTRSCSLQGELTVSTHTNTRMNGMWCYHSKQPCVCVSLPIKAHTLIPNVPASLSTFILSYESLLSCTLWHFYSHNLTFFSYVASMKSTLAADFFFHVYPHCEKNPHKPFDESC